ncbi:MAG: GGDEF domain-containing protein [Candidatus Thiodiazotropha sp. (ex Lucinoma borealis)]|nr:GGDEF domain-containing protein [Candidatus Thiodiazotropha sp. (ex Lucinoma borealis)]
MTLLEKSLARLNELWSLTRYEGAELSEYAESLVFQETRKGIVILGLVSLLLLSTSALAYTLLGFEALYVYSCVVLAVLSLHVAVSARVVQEINTLYLLGITLLVVNGVAFVLLAHHSGSLNSALFASVILLFLVMPLVPWGVREALLIVLLVYFLFTLSTISVDGRFEKETLWMLQFSMLGAGLTTLTVIGRNVMVRKIDIRTRFELEKAHDRMELLSLKDPLTGAWNRRFLDQKFLDIRTAYDLNGNTMHLALIDVDNFKILNDSQGHDYGDLVLRRLVVNFLALFSGNEHLIRMGGDEFLLILSQDDPESILQQGAIALRTDPQLFSGSADSQVNVSVGLVSIDVKSNMSLDLIYRQVDEELYQAKERKNRESKCSSQATVLSGV